MYQVEREKLAQKYRMKDETIRKLNTQLQMNKFGIKELNDYFNQYLNNINNVFFDQYKLLNFVYYEQSFKNNIVFRKEINLISTISRKS